MIGEAHKGEIPKEIKPYNIESRRTIDSELNERAIDLIKRNAEQNKLFFNFIPYTQPHLTTIPHPYFNGKTGNGFYTDVLAEIDYRAGQILDTLDELNILNDNLIFRYLALS